MQYKQALSLAPSDFKRLYGVTPDTFWEMVKSVRNAKQGKQGSHSKLSIPNQVLLTLEYWREYRTFFHISQDWAIHESTACRTVQRIENILINRLKFRIPGKKKLQKTPDKNRLIAVDVSEVKVERPKKNKRETIAARKKAIHSNFN